MPICKTILDFQKMKVTNSKISMITCYDFWTAQIINKSTIDCVLVGDSLAMVMHGHPTTIPAQPEMMALHVAAVTRGISDKLIIADMPFLSYRKGLREAMNCVELLMNAGAHAVKLEGVEGHEDIVSHIVKSGVPVMGHLGLTPQYIHQLGGPRIQGRDSDAADLLLTHAQKLEELGCFGLVLECIPANLSKRITDALKIPTIGIGAGPYVSGQVLVLHDMLGMLPQFQLKFVRKYLDGLQLFVEALDHYNRDVKGSEFPLEQESFR